MKGLSFFLSSFVFLFSSCGSATDEQFKPLFSGLEGGTLNGEYCVSFSDFSVKMEYKDLDYAFGVYKNKNCGDSDVFYDNQLPAEARLAGIWHNFIVIDIGSGSDSRELFLLDTKLKNIKEIPYVDIPLFTDRYIHFFIDTEKSAAEKDCPEQKDDF